MEVWYQPEAEKATALFPIKPSSPTKDYNWDIDRITEKFKASNLVIQGAPWTSTEAVNKACAKTMNASDTSINKQNLT